MGCKHLQTAETPSNLNTHLTHLVAISCNKYKQWESENFVVSIITAIPISIVAGGEVVEPPENFTVELEIPEDTKSYSVVALEPSTAEIVITDGMKFLHSHTFT